VATVVRESGQGASWCYDPLVRRSEPDAVHQLRGATRRTRSVIRERQACQAARIEQALPHFAAHATNNTATAGWGFLRPHLAAANAYVFSRRQYAPAWVPSEKVWVIPTSIDPFSPKNQDLDGGTLRAIRAKIGVLDGAAPVEQPGDLQGWPRLWRGNHPAPGGAVSRQSPGQEDVGPGHSRGQ
jgi:hypothetical protein